MLYYNKDVFAAAGLDPENPELATYDDVLAAAAAVKESGAADYSLYPPASGDYTNSLFDFYPFFLANSGGTQLVSDGAAAFTSEEGLETLEFWKTMYGEGYSSAEAYSGDAWAGPFADGVSAMGIAGPWGAGAFDGKVEYGVVPLPTAAGTAAADTYTFGDSKNVGLYTSCENKQTAWDFVKFSMDAENDLALLETWGGSRPAPMSMRSPPTTSRRTPCWRPSPPRCPSRSTCRTSRTPPRCGRRSVTPGVRPCRRERATSKRPSRPPRTRSMP